MGVKNVSPYDYVMIYLWYIHHTTAYHRYHTEQMVKTYVKLNIKGEEKLTSRSQEAGEG